MSDAFLEGNYDSGKEDGQAKEDRFQAERIEAQAEELKEKFYSNYGDEENKNLVDGAILTCNMATTDVQVIRGTVFGTRGTGIRGEKKYTKLSVPIGISEASELGIATVKSREKGNHILPFECNCMHLPDREWEMEKIFSDLEECKKFGTCRQLMKLDNDWENVIKETSYQSFGTEEGEQAEVVTMMSMLFCSHGGLITPVDSGQREMTRTIAISILDMYLRTGKTDEYDAWCALKYLARQSEYSLMQYESAMGYDYNKYDAYILGWTEYYNELSSIKIDPNYIKSQCYQESRIGNNSGSTKKIPAANEERDIMQVLDVRNYNIYEYIGIAPSNFKIFTSEKTYKTGSIVWGLNLGALDPPAPEPEAGKYDAEKEKRCGGIIKTLFNTQIDGSGNCYFEGSTETYYYQLEAVTPIMSLALGMDKMRELMDKHSGNNREALKEYNGKEGSKEAYAKKIIDRAEMQSDTDTIKLE